MRVQIPMGLLAAGMDPRRENGTVVGCTPIPRDRVMGCEM